MLTSGASLTGAPVVRPRALPGIRAFRRFLVCQPGDRVLPIGFFRKELDPHAEASSYNVLCCWAGCLF